MLRIFIAPGLVAVSPAPTFATGVQARHFAGGFLSLFLIDI